MRNKILSALILSIVFSGCQTEEQRIWSNKVIEVYNECISMNGFSNQSFYNAYKSSINFGGASTNMNGYTLTGLKNGCEKSHRIWSDRDLLNSGVNVEKFRKQQDNYNPNALSIEERMRLKGVNINRDAKRLEDKLKEGNLSSLELSNIRYEQLRIEKQQAKYNHDYDQIDKINEKLSYQKKITSNERIKEQVQKDTEKLKMYINNSTTATKQEKISIDRNIKTYSRKVESGRKKLENSNKNLKKTNNSNYLSSGDE